MGDSGGDWGGGGHGQLQLALGGRSRRSVAFVRMYQTALNACGQSPCGVQKPPVPRHNSMMKRLWLLFSQAATVLLATYFVVLTLKPQWLHRLDHLAWSSHNLVTRAPVTQKAPSAAGSLRAAAEAALPAVVSIQASKAGDAQQDPRSNDPLFRFFFGDPEQNPTAPGRANMGSGVIVSPRGYILTNHHVVENADTIQVTLADGRRTSASLLGVDPDTDLAVLQIAIGEVPAITMGDSNAIFVGDTVLAIGNPFGVGQTVTSGIVSALGRTQLGINTYENFIQTDAAINPGNSGGALVDVNGDLVGINTAIYSQSGGSLGIGFAIPASVASSVLQDIVEKGSVTRGWIGIEPQTLTPEMASNLDLNVNKGVLVAGVLQSGPASRAGIRPGDVMLSIDKQDIQSVRDLLNIVSALAPGATTDVAIWRNGQQLALSIKPQQRPHPHQRSR